MLLPSGPSSPITIATTSDLDEKARARYEGLVFGERLLVSESVLTEIFREQEIVVIHCIALEMAYADMALRHETWAGVVQRIEIIQLDDDNEMVDFSQNGVTGN
ncbi:unnamed protein product [Eruca vesicaria subsp. sativa]|uniref:Uncharacterized protein n=1 Tax=Eruca vesicaria subsp. sativa TaxID=29727 RepID=A0ABC8KDG5_ERUVS|nr:unnamed protein product [Eruca vesicaria subsp. sativa]